jgi:hypothetical protein
LTITHASKLMILAGLALGQSAHAERQDAAPIADIDKLLTGVYGNAAQVARGKTTGQTHPPQHVTIRIEPTQLAGWEIWRIHMDVDPAVARDAGSDTALDAVWAMNVLRQAQSKPLQFVPYSLLHSVDAGAAQAASFDQSQWLSIEACALDGEARGSRLLAQLPADAMCVAVSMSLGGKRAFLPSRIERDGEWLHVDLVYFGKPWRVDARRERAGVEPKPGA